MIVEILRTDIEQGKTVRFEYKTSLSDSHITGILPIVSSGKIECSFYQANRSKAVFRKLDFADCVTEGGFDVKTRKGWQKLNVSANGDKVTGTVKGLEITGMAKVTIYLRIDE